MVRIAFDAIYAHPLPENHRFPMLKYELIPAQLLHEGTYTADHFFIPKACDASVVLKTHEADYYQKLISLQLSAAEQRAIGFPQSKTLIEREFIITQGTIDCSIAALANGISLNVAGGTHHAFADRGEGFCILNDMCVAANYLLDHNYCKKIMIVDLDVHQGNGTAKIMENNPDVFTFSMHGATNYPFRKEKSDLDIALENSTNDETYLTILKKTLPKLIYQENPDFIYYLCGVDVIESDKLGKLSLTIGGCKERDRFVLQTCFDHKIPVMCSMGGGYSPDIKTIVEAHANTFRLAQEIYF